MFSLSSVVCSEHGDCPLSLSRVGDPARRQYSLCCGTNPKCFKCWLFFSRYLDARSMSFRNSCELPVTRRYVFVSHSDFFRFLSAASCLGFLRVITYFSSSIAVLYGAFFRFFFFCFLSPCRCQISPRSYHCVAVKRRKNKRVVLCLALVFFVFSFLVGRPCVALRTKRP